MLPAIALILATTVSGPQADTDVDPKVLKNCKKAGITKAVDIETVSSILIYLEMEKIRVEQRRALPTCPAFPGQKGIICT